MTEQPTKIYLTDFYFNTKQGTEVKIEGLLCLKLPDIFVKEDVAYKKALRLLATKKVAATPDKFRVEFTKQIGHTHTNYGIYA